MFAMVDFVLKSPRFWICAPTVNGIDHCPWNEFQPATVSFCEAPVCHWVREPANAYSSLAYILVGLYVLWRARRDRASILALIGWVGVMVGLGSFFFHASTAWAGEVLDLVSMYLLIALMLTLELRCFVALSARQLVAFFTTLVAFSVTLLFTYKTLGIAVFGVQAFSVIVMQIVQWRTRPGDYGKLAVLHGTFDVAWLVWFSDLTRTACNPHNHVLNGHAIWHFGSALVLAFYYAHHLQFFAPAPSTKPAALPVTLDTYLEA